MKLNKLSNNLSIKLIKGTRKPIPYVKEYINNKIVLK